MSHTDRTETQSENDNPLWRFACLAYQDAELAEQLLHHQDADGGDILLYLTALWLHTRGICASHIPHHALADYKKWRPLIESVRQTRRTSWLKPANLDAYTSLKQAELSLEKAAIGAIYCGLCDLAAQKKPEKGLVGNESLALSQPIYQRLMEIT